MATVAVLLALVVAAFETTVVTTAMPTLTAELDGRALYAWVFTGFLLASTLGVLLGGRLSDRLGRRGTFVAGMGLFLLGSVLCGFSTSVPMLVGFRVLQGLGAGAVQPTTLTISSDLYTLEERAAIQSVFTGAWADRFPDQNSRAADKVLQWVSEGRLRPHVDRVLPLERAAEAMSAIENRSVAGRIVLKVR